MKRRLGVSALVIVALQLLGPGSRQAYAQTTVAGSSTAAFVPPVARDRPFELSIRNIMRGYELVGRSPEDVRWSADSRWIYFQWLPGGADWDEEARLYRVPAAGGEPEPVDDADAERVELLLAGGSLSPDGTTRLVEMDGDLWLVDSSGGNARQLTRTTEAERSASFSRDGARVFFRRGNDFFSLGLDGGGLVQVTDIRSGSPPAEEPEAEGQRAFLERQQEELFEHVRRENARRDEARAERAAALEAEPAPLYVPENERVRTLAISPDGLHVVVSTSDPAEAARETMVPDWVTSSGYTEELEARTKVGDARGTSRIALHHAGVGETRWLDPTPEGYEGAADAFFAGWNETGTYALLYARSADNADWWLWSLDVMGDLTLLDSLHDDAWVAGPCRFCSGWVPGSDRVWYVSEESGYAHLYTVNADGTDRRALTSGAWEVLDVTIPEGESRFLITTNEGSPFNQHVAWLDPESGERDYLTEGAGEYELTPSPDGERFAVIHSKANRPEELYVTGAGGEGLEQVTVSPTADWLTFGWLEPEIVHVPAEDGTPVPARIYRPADFGVEPNGAGVIFVHGAGYLHNVHNYWSSYFREYMFHHFLAAAGYTVLDIDYRGSAGYGREWRTAIDRWMGGKDLSDQIDGARYLVAFEGVDPERIGIYGGSYGGFITLMAMFTAGDTFKAGAALRSVTDWAHYNHPYTSNILNLPQDDEEAYRRSSPIYFAEDFGPGQHLLILHGMVDTNVHFSDVVRLAQRLIELGKEDWEMAVYPVEGHGFVEPTSWTDEYRRIFELFERTIRDVGCTEAGGVCAPRHAEN